MSAVWQKLADLIAAGDVRGSEHGYDALAYDALGSTRFFPAYPGPSCLRNAPTIPKARQYSCFSWMPRETLCTRYGAFFAVTKDPPCW
jgi:hypothetical protein